MKVIKLLLLGILINNIGLQAQVKPPVDPQQIEKSVTPIDPTVSELGKYAMQAPSFSNGLPQQNIPLHTIKEPGIEYPISMSYSYSGFQPTQEATELGLGWVMTGGVITRVVKGLPDDNMSIYKKFGQFDYFHLVNEFGYGQWPEPSAPPKVYDYTANRIYNKLYDGQPDVYVFNFNGHSGRFLFIRDTAYVYPYDDYKIKKLDIGYGTGFIIATPDGLEYTFESKDWTTTNYYNADRNTMTDAFYGLEPSGNNGPLTFTGGLTTTAWRLTKIVNKTTKATINLTYASYTINKSKWEISAFTFWNNPQAFYDPYLYQVSSAWNQALPNNPTVTQSVGFYLTGITSEHETVSIKTKDRADYEANTQAKAIDEIDIYSNANLQSPVKTIKLTHDYFTENGFSADDKWLKLNKVVISGEGESKTYSFKYNEANEPISYWGLSKSGYSFDHWGYYNGASNQYMIPRCNIINSLVSSHGFSEEMVNSIPWANRNPDYNFAKVFALSQITYPTGGYSKITYESAGGRGIRVRATEDNDGENSYKKFYTYYPDDPVPEPPYNFSSYTLDPVTNAPGRLYGPDKYFTITGTTKAALDFFDDNSNFYTDVTEFIGTPQGHGGRTVYHYIRDYSSYTPYLTETDYYRYNEIDPLKKTVNTYVQLPLRTIQFYTDPYVFLLGNRAIYQEQGGDWEYDSPLDPLIGYNYFLSDMGIGTNTLNINWFKLTQTDIYEYSNETIVNSVKYFYHDVDNTTGWPANTNVIRTESASSKGDITSAELYFPGDIDPDNPGSRLGIPEMWDKSNANYKYYTSPVVKTRTFINNVLKEYSANQYNYNASQDLLLQSMIEKHPTGTASAEKYNFTYDNKANIISSRKENDVEKVFVWGYNNRYPVAEITGTSYQAVMNMLNQSILLNPASDLELRNELNKIRQQFPNAMVITYTYDPLLGMTSHTDVRNHTTFYEYDVYGRMKLLRDQDGNIIKTFKYNYKQ